MKYLAACTVIIGCIVLANPAFAGDTRIIIKADLGLFDNVRHHYDRHYRPFAHRYDRRYDRRHDTIIIHRAPRVIHSPFNSFRHGFWHDNGRRGYDKHWRGPARHHDNRRFRDHRQRWR